MFGYKLSKLSGTILCSLPLAFVSAAPAMADEAKSKVVLDRVMVVGDPDNINDLTGSAHYIGSEELDKHSYGDIHRVLRQVPGVTIQEEEGYGNRPNIGIRGGRSERSADITLMEDGVLIAPAPYASPSAYYFPRVDRMEAVEVRKGSSSIKFGPRTTSGAVNLISRSVPQQSEGNLLLGYGNNNTQRAQFNYGNTIDNVGFVFDLGHEATDGFKDIDTVGGDTGFSIQDVMGKLKFTSPASANMYQSLEFKIGGTQEDSDETYLGLTQADFDADPFRRYASTQRDNMDSDHQMYMIRHYIEPAEGWDVTTTLYRNDFARNWYKLQAVEVGGSKLNLGDALNSTAHLDALKGNTDLAGDADNNLVIRANNREYYSQGAQSNVGKQFKVGKSEHQLEVGVRFHYDEEDRFQQEDLYSITSGVMDLTSAGAPGSNANRVGSARALAIHAIDEIDIGKWHFTPGVRFEHIELKRDNRATNQIDKNDFDVVIPGLGVGYDVTDATSIFGGVHKGFAPPAPSTDTSQREEESVNYELGVRHNQGSFHTELVGYFNDYDNLLGKETLSGGGGTGTGEQFNGGEVDAYGIEFVAGYDLAQPLKINNISLPTRFNYSYTKAEFQSSFNSSFDEWGSVNEGDELPYIPEHQFTLSQGVVDDKWEIHLAVTYVDEMRTTAGSGAIPAGEGTDSHFVVDIAGEYEFYKGVRAFASVNNLFDEEYVAARRPAGARPGAPLLALAGIKYSF